MPYNVIMKCRMQLSESATRRKKNSWRKSTQDGLRGQGSVSTIWETLLSIIIILHKGHTLFNWWPHIHTLPDIDKQQQLMRDLFLWLCNKQIFWCIEQIKNVVSRSLSLPPFRCLSSYRCVCMWNSIDVFKIHGGGHGNNFKLNGMVRLSSARARVCRVCAREFVLFCLLLCSARIKIDFTEFKVDIFVEAKQLCRVLLCVRAICQQ